jgi:hypothetical protein
MVCRMTKTQCLKDRLSQPFGGAECSPAPHSRFSEGAPSTLGRALLAPYITRRVFAAGEEVANQRYRRKPAEAWKATKPRASRSSQLPSCLGDGGWSGD